MPVISCPDCGRDVSTLAPACPHCGRPSPAATAPILPAGGPAQAKEETVWSGSPSWRLLIGRIVTLILLAVLLPLITHMLADSAGDENTRGGVLTVGWIATGAAILLLGVSIAVSLIRLRSTQYIVTNQRLLVETGLFTKRVEEVDMRLIDDSTFHQTFLQRVLGIGDVTVRSTDKNTPVQMLLGVADPRAVRELIRTHSYQASQRQVFTRPT